MYIVALAIWVILIISAYRSKAEFTYNCTDVSPGKRALYTAVLVPVVALVLCVSGFAIVIIGKCLIIIGKFALSPIMQLF